MTFGPLQMLFGDLVFRKQAKTIAFHSLTKGCTLPMDHGTSVAAAAVGDRGYGVAPNAQIIGIGTMCGQQHSFDPSAI